MEGHNSTKGNQPSMQSAHEVQDASQNLIYLFSHNQALTLRIEQALQGEPVRILHMEMTIPLSTKTDDPIRVAIIDVDDDLETGGRWIDEVRKRLRGVPIVVFTNNSGHEFGIQIISRGIQCFYEYDFCVSEFVEVIHNLLSKPTTRSNRG